MIVDQLIAVGRVREMRNCRNCIICYAPLCYSTLYRMDYFCINLTAMKHTNPAAYEHPAKAINPQYWP